MLKNKTKQNEQLSVPANTSRAQASFLCVWLPGTQASVRSERPKHKGPRFSLVLPLKVYVFKTVVLIWRCVRLTPSVQEPQSFWKDEFSSKIFTRLKKIYIFNFDFSTIVAFLFFFFLMKLLAPCGKYSLYFLCLKVLDCIFLQVNSVASHWWLRSHPEWWPWEFSKGQGK